MKIVRLNKDILMPKKSHLPDCGLDLFLPQNITFNSFQTKTIGLGLKVAIPEGFAGMIVPRSSISEKGLIIQTAIIDPDYTGEIHLIATNCSENNLHFSKGDRLCSLVMLNCLNARVEEVDELEKTNRGSNGLGSTGK